MWEEKTQFHYSLDYLRIFPSVEWFMAGTLNYQLGDKTNS